MILNSFLYSCETRLYISSLFENATLVNNPMRSHWTVENNLHWCLDVIMKKDGQLNYVENAAENRSMMKKVQNIVRKMKKAVLDQAYRELLLKV